jgi:hypothetical protein
LPKPRDDRFSVIAFNTSDKPRKATMTGWNVQPGRWRMRIGADRDGDGRIDGRVQEREVVFERSGSLPVEFAPRQGTVIEMELIAADTPVELRADLGIGRGDVRIDGDVVEVTVHSLGHVGAPAGVVVLEDARGRELARAAFPALPAPSDLQPRTATVRLSLPVGLRGVGGRVVVRGEGDVAEVTQVNNRVVLP